MSFLSLLPGARIEGLESQTETALGIEVDS